MRNEGENGTVLLGIEFSMSEAEECSSEREECKTPSNYEREGKKNKCVYLAENVKG